MTIHVVCGWVGVSLIFTAYALNSYKWIERGVPYQAMNMAGAVLYGFDLYVRSAWSGVTLEIVWFSIAITAVMKITFARRKSMPAKV